MVTGVTRLRPNDEEVAAKVMDGEAIIINLATGSYYSMANVGGLIWESIEQQCSLEEVAQRVSTHYDVPVDRARTDVLALAAHLLDEGVVKVVVDSHSPAHQPSPPTQRLPYEAPALSVYSDMRSLLALDPPMPSLDVLERKDGPSGRSR